MSLIEACGTDNPLVRDGKSQSQRLPEALLPSYVAVDERSTADLLVFAKKYATQIRYFNTKNEENGDWEDFFSGDISTQIALILAEDTDQTRENWELYLEGLQDDPNRTNLTILFQFLLDMFEEVETWSRRISDMEDYSEEIDSVIKSTLRLPLERLISYDLGAVELSDTMSPEPIGLDYSYFSQLWVSQPDADNPIGWNTFVTDHIEANTLVYIGDDETGTGDENKILNAAEKLDIIFQTLLEAQIRIISQAGTYLEQTLTDWPTHQPHFALFISFLKLLEYVRDHLNGLTGRHLDFYYNRVLGLAPGDPVPDRVHVLFQLAKNTDTHKLTEGTQLKAGKDDNGVDLLYNLENEIVVNKATVADLKTIFVDEENNASVHAAPVANSEDGAGAEFEKDSLGNWKPFGNSENPQAETLGFSLTSPVLAMKEGSRFVEITLDFPEGVFNDWDDVYSDADCPGFNSLNAEEADKPFRVFLTGEEEWYEVEDYTLEALGTGTTDMVFSFTLDATVPPIVGWSEGTHGGGFNTSHPMVKFLVNDTLVTNPYKWLRGFTVTGVGIKVTVTGVKNLVVQNDLTVMDSSKPFQPFGPNPYLGSKFYVGSPEIFRKKLDDLTLNVKWANLPDVSFADYYNDPYDQNSVGISGNDVFKVEWTCLEDREFQPLLNPPINPVGTDALYSLFTDEPGGEPKEDSSFSFDNDHDLSLFDIPALNLEDFEEWDVNSQRGFLRAELSEVDFRHADYVNIFAKSVIELASVGTGVEIPNKPWTPVIESISMDYESSVYIDLTPFVEGETTTLLTGDLRVAYEDRVEQFYHLQPFGYQELHPENDLPLLPTDSTPFTPFPLLPHYDQEGYLFIGVEDLVPGQTLSLLFQVLEASADPDADDVEGLTWYYLTENTWTEFRPSEIPSDTTSDLSTSGIIKFSVPTDATKDNTVMPQGYYWIMGLVSDNSEAVSDLISIQAQAAVAIFEDNDNDPNHLANPLEAESVSKLFPKQAQVKSVTQPFSSFGGALKETDEAYYLRVAERLRHKQRAITIHDYETLVLGEFSSIYKVRCLNHTNRYTQLAPGHVYLIVISNTINKNAVNPLEPKVDVSTLKAIREFLAPLMSTFVCLEVRNPTYEQLTASGTVYLRPGYDQNEYETQLEEDVKEFLSPWAFAEGQEISFGGKIHRSMILNFIEEREYVDYVVDFELYQTTENGSLLVEEAEPSTPMSVLVSNTEHNLNTIVADATVTSSSKCN